MTSTGERSRPEVRASSTNRGQVSAPNARDIILAWIGTLLASTLPAILWQNLLSDGSGDPSWLPPSIRLQTGALALLVLGTMLWPAARLVRVPLLMLLSFLVGWRIVTPLITQTAAWTDWQARQSIGASLLTSRLQWLPPILMMALVAFGAGVGRPYRFLGKGNWAVPVMWSPLFPLKGWTWFPRTFVVFFLLAFLLTAPTWVHVVKPDFDKANRVLVHLPGIAAGAALNAMCEEFIFRVMPLACFIPAVGTRHALALTAILFGLEHWQTAGIAVVLTCYCGWLYAKSMVETGGWTWALVQHVLGDVPIYAIIAMGRP